MNQSVKVVAQTAMLAALAAGVVLLLYAGSYGYPLVFDDVVLGEQSLASAPGSPRWLAYSTFTVTTALAGFSVEWLRFENVLLHACAVVALFFFCRNLIGDIGRNPYVVRQAGDGAALAAAAVFAVHPVTVYGVAYLAQRPIVMATLFSVLSLDAWLRGLRWGGRWWLAASAIFYALAVLSKEHAVMLPAVALALTVSFRHETWVPRRQLAAALAVQVVIGLAVVFQMSALLGAAYEPHAAGGIAAVPAIEVASGQLYSRSVLTQCLLFFGYVVTWIIPLPQLMSIDLRWDLFSAPLSAVSLAAGFGYLAVGAGAIRWLFVPGLRSGIGFAVLCTWLLYFTEFAAVRVQEPFVLYRSYLWGIGFSVLVAVIASVTPARVLAACAIVACAALGIGMRDRLGTFETPVALWDDAVRKLPAQRSPFADRAIGNRGVALMRAGRLEEARRDFDEAVKINPASPVAWFNRAMLLAFLGEIPRAQADLAEAQRLQRAMK